MRRRDLYWAALLLPLPLLSVGSARLADRIGKNSGAELARIVQALRPAAKRSDTLLIDVPLIQEAAPAAVVENATPLASKAKARRKKAAPAAPATKGLRVSAQTVLRLAARGAAPRAVPVAAQGARPAGLRLVNVSGLGIGVRDGDVLTDAAGTPVRSVGDVIGIVVSARARMAPEISGHFFRGAERWVIVVEQPYPKESATSKRATETANPNAISEGSSPCGEVVPLTSAGPCSKSRKL